MQAKSTQGTWRLKRRGEGRSYGPYTKEQLREFCMRAAQPSRTWSPMGPARCSWVTCLPIPPPHPRRCRRGVRLEPPDEEQMGWSWGAFGLGLIWVIGNRVWMPGLLLLIGLVPYVGWLWNVGLIIYLGVGVTAWRGARAASVAQSSSGAPCAPGIMRGSSSSWWPSSAGRAGRAAVPVLSSAIPQYDVFVKPEAARPRDADVRQRLRRTLPSSGPMGGGSLALCRVRTNLGCPAGSRYVYNPGIAGRSMADVEFPAGTVLLYEVGSSGQPAFDAHLNGHEHMNVAFADGHCEAISRSMADQSTYGDCLDWEGAAYAHQPKRRRLGCAGRDTAEAYLATEATGRAGELRSLYRAAAAGIPG